MQESSAEFDQVRRFMQKHRVGQGLSFYTLESSLAHVRMLGETGIIEGKVAAAVAQALLQIKDELGQGKSFLSLDDFDVQAALERRCAELVGESSDVLHLAKSSNDQIATDIRLWLREVVFDLFAQLLSSRNIFITLAERDFELIMPGYTHMQPAIPILLSHFWLAHEERFRRDFQRLGDFYKRFNALPLGACALGGTSLPIDREATARYLGFDRVIENSLDAVSDRDYLIEFGSFASLTATHVSQLSFELLLWSTQEFGFARLGRAFLFGSQSMPQKKNPALMEVLRARPAAIYGGLMEFLSQLKGLPMGYSQDLDESISTLMNMVSSLKEILELQAVLLPAVEFDGKRMREAASSDLSSAGNAVDFLLSRGIATEKAASIVEGLVSYCRERNKYLADLSLSEWQQFSPAFDMEIYKYVTVEDSVGSRSSFGGTASTQVAQAIVRAREALHADYENIPQKAHQKLKVHELESI